MTIKPKQIKIKDLFDGFEDNGDNGIVGYHGQLNIRPKFQREFIYEPEDQKAVINTVLNGFPLNTMYWAVARNDVTQEPITTEDGKQIYELLDGQQRTLSICYYLESKFSFNNLTAYNLKKSYPDKYAELMEYPLQVYICDGKTSEKLAWFRTINIAGKALSEQELLNAQYTGPWLTDAKSYFSRPGKNADARPVVRNHDTSAYFKFSASKNEGVNRQTLLQYAIEWKTAFDGLPARTLKGDSYMSKHQGDKNADELKSYFNSVFDWVGSKFSEYRSAEKGLPWGEWYNEYKAGKFNGNLIDKDSMTIEEELKKLDEDDDVQSTKGEYRYILTNDPKYLNIRAFDPADAKTVYAQQKGKCPMCDKNIGNHTYPQNQATTKYGPNTYEFKQMQADHIVPWSKGGHTVRNNLQMLCEWHNKFKSNI